MLSGQDLGGGDGRSELVGPSLLRQHHLDLGLDRRTHLVVRDEPGVVLLQRLVTPQNPVAERKRRSYILVRRAYVLVDEHLCSRRVRSGHPRDVPGDDERALADAGTLHRVRAKPELEFVPPGVGVHRLGVAELGCGRVDDAQVGLGVDGCSTGRSRGRDGHDSDNTSDHGDGCEAGYSTKEQPAQRLIHNALPFCSSEEGKGLYHQLAEYTQTHHMCLCVLCRCVTIQYVKVRAS